MAKNFFNTPDQMEILQRLEQLTVNQERRWGTMSAGEMVCHLRDQMAIALGERPTQQQGFWLMRTGLGRWMGLYLIPWRKGKEQAPKEMNQSREGSRPGDFTRDKADLLQLLHRFATAEARDLANHPYFGRFSKKDWGRMIWKHTDHHLRQFGL